MTELHLHELSAANVVAANTLSLKPGQEQYVAPVANSIAEASVNADTMWPRVAMMGDEVVGFILGNFDKDAEEETHRCTVLRMNVDGEHQGEGIGTFLMNEFIDEARRRGFSRVTAVWEEGEMGPGEFFRSRGFTVRGDTPYGEVIGALAIGNE